MREILFRGKCVVTNEWVEGYLLKSKIGGNEVEMIIPQGKFTDLFSKNKMYQVLTETVGQYTGMTDKNGTKLFEGDILKSDDGNIGIIRWYDEETAFMIWCTNKYRLYYLGDNNFSRIEAIGNIHDKSRIAERG